MQCTAVNNIKIEVHEHAKYGSYRTEMVYEMRVVKSRNPWKIRYK
jgi:hypothetical protein